MNSGPVYRPGIAFNGMSSVLSGILAGIGPTFKVALLTTPLGAGPCPAQNAFVEASYPGYARATPTGTSQQYGVAGIEDVGGYLLSTVTIHGPSSGSPVLITGWALVIVMPAQPAIITVGADFPEPFLLSNSTSALAFAGAFIGFSGAAWPGTVAYTP